MKNDIKYGCYVHSLQRTIKNMPKSKSTFCIFTWRQGYMQVKANILYNDFSEVLSDSVHDSSFSPSDPISQFHDGEDPWLVCLTHQGTATGGDRQFDPISPTVPFSVQEQVFMPLTLEECVTLLHACPPIKEETLVYAAHPGFVFFLIRLGSSLAIDGERLTETRQGPVSSQVRVPGLISALCA